MSSGQLNKHCLSDSDLPPVHVAADHEAGRAVPEVDAREVAEGISQLREAAFCFQAVHQDLAAGEKHVGAQSTHSLLTTAGPHLTQHPACS